jgi:hypothetical protein
VCVGVGGVWLCAEHHAYENCYNSYVMRRALRSCAHGPDGAGHLRAACTALAQACTAGSAGFRLCLRHTLVVRQEIVY